MQPFIALIILALKGIGMDMNLNKNDMKAVLNFISNINDIDINQTDFRQSIIKTLGENFGYHHLTFFLVDDTVRSYDPSVINMSSTLMNDYKQYYFQTDVFQSSLFRMIYKSNTLYKPTVMSIKHIMNYESFENTEFYNDLLKKYNLHRELALPLQKDNHLLGCIGILKEKGEGNFTARDIYIGDILNKHISASFSHHLITKKLNNDNQILHATFLKLQIGVIILDSNFQPITMNEAAEDYCNELTNELSILNTVNNVVSAILSEMAMKPTPISPQLQVICGHLDIKIFPFIAPEANGNLTTYYTMYLTNMDTSFNTLLKHFTTQHGLTDREIEILNLIIAGMNNSEIGDYLYISINTVKTHILNIFKKCQVSGRVELINKCNKHQLK